MKNDLPLVSILMPVKNTATYLAECIASIQAQAYQNWELIAVDDSSTDASFEILQIFAATDQRITALKNRGKGIIEGLRTAYSVAQGTYITRMDSDDRMRPQKLAALLNPLLEKGTGRISVGLVHYFSADPLGEGYQKYAAWLNNLTQDHANFSERYRECVIPSPCWMCHREDLDVAGAFSSDRYPEDYDLCFRFYAQGLEVEGVNAVLHDWRDYGDRTSRNDPNYADNRFLPLKVHYFLQLDWNKTRPLVLWGAGKKGKAIARLLQEQGVKFRWVCDNANKIGKSIYEVMLYSYKEVLQLENPQVILAVAGSDEQAEINLFLLRSSNLDANDRYWFC